MLACLSGPKQYPVVQRCFECDESGALLHCTLCQRGFHVVCAQTGKPLLPSWLCRHCQEVTEKELKSQADKLLEEQYKKKDAILRKWKRLTKSELGIFQAAHPELCNRGHVQYPIEDLLLATRPKLHGVKGRPLPLPASDSLLGKLLYIADFMFVFREVFRTPPFSAMHLKAALQMNMETTLLKSTILALELVGITSMKKHNVTDRAARFRVAESLEIDILPQLHLYYLAVLEDLLWSWGADDDVQTILPLIEKRPIEGHFYSLYTVAEKTDVLYALAQVALGSKPVRDEIQRISDERRKLTRLRKEQRTKLRTELSVLPDLESTERQLTNLMLGPEVLGQDREFREYLYSGSDVSGLYVRFSAGEEALWRYLDSREVASVVAVLNHKGVRERRLKSAISSLRLIPAQFETMVLDHSVRIQGVKDLLFAVEAQVTEVLQVKKYVWAQPDFTATWKQSVSAADSDFALAAVFRQFVEKATAPLVQTKTGELRQCTAKYRNPVLQDLWRQLYDKVVGAYGLSFQILTFPGACQLRLKRLRRDDSDEPIGKLAKTDDETAES